MEQADRITPSFQSCCIVDTQTPTLWAWGNSGRKVPISITLDGEELEKHTRLECP